MNRRKGVRYHYGSLVGILLLSACISTPAHASTFVLIHGAWHGAWAFADIVPRLEAAGHEAIAIDLPGHGLDATPVDEITLDTYAKRVIEVIDERDEKVILVAHSLGGGTATLVSEMRADAIEAVVYVAAFMPRTGETLLSLAASDEQAQVYPNLIFDKAPSLSFFSRDAARTVFYPDVPEVVARRAILRLNSQPLAPYGHVFSLTAEHYGAVPRYYIKTLQDLAVTPHLQQRMIDASPPQEVVEVNSGHSPFLANPDEFVEKLLSLFD